MPDGGSHVAQCLDWGLDLVGSGLSALILEEVVLVSTVNVHPSRNGHGAVGRGGQSGVKQWGKVISDSSLSGLLRGSVSKNGRWT